MLKVAFSRRLSSGGEAMTNGGLKRRLSLSEVLNSQKRMRPSPQTVRQSFGSAFARPSVDGGKAKPAMMFDGKSTEEELDEGGDEAPEVSDRGEGSLPASSPNTNRFPTGAGIFTTVFSPPPFALETAPASLATTYLDGL